MKQRRKINRKGWILLAAMALLVVALSISLYSVLTGKTTLGTLMPAKKIVSLYVDGAPYAQLQVIAGTTQSVPSYVTKTGYVFQGWAYEDGSMYDREAGLKRGRRVDLFAVFTPEENATASEAAAAAAATATSQTQTIDLSYTVGGK